MKGRLGRDGMLVDPLKASRYERLNLLKLRPNYDIDNKHLVVGLAHEFIHCKSEEEWLQRSAFLVEMLFKYGELSLAARVVMRRQELAFPSVGYDSLALSYRTLMQYDFDLPPAAAGAPLYSVDAVPPGGPLKVLSFYYGTPSYQHNGYAIRSQAILKNTGHEVLPFGRIGYPWIAGLLRDNQKTVTGRVDGIEYHHRRGEVRTQNELFLNFGLAKTEICSLIAEHRPHLVHAASNFTVGMPALLAARACRLPFVYEMRGIWELTAGVGVHGWKASERFAVERRMETFLASQADRVITLTDTQKQELVSRGIHADKVDVVANCFEGEQDHGDAEEFLQPLRERFAGRKVIGYVGSLVNYEGLQLLVEALAKRHPGLEDVCCLIVGDGPYAEELRAIVAASGIADRIHMTGRVSRSDAHAAYGLIDLCVLPRIDNEVVQLVSPLKLIEILALGKVLLVSDVDAMAELVHKTGYGELFRSGDVEDLVARLVEIRRDLPALQERYAGAREHVLAHHTWKQGAKLWDATLEAAVAASRQAIAEAPPEPQAMDALRTVRPAITAVQEQPAALLQRLVRARLPAGTHLLRLLLPEAMADALEAVAVEEGSGIGTTLTFEREPTATEGSAALTATVDAAVSVVLLFHLPQATAAQARPASWVLSRHEASAAPSVVKLFVEADDIVGFRTSLKEPGQDLLLLASGHPETVRYVVAATPLDGAATSPGFERLTYSSAIDARFQYVRIEAGKTQLPLRTGITGAALVEFAPWQDGYRRKPGSVTVSAVGRHATIPRSKALSLPTDRHNVLVAARINENLIDGSIIWLKSLVTSIAARPDVNVYVMTNSVAVPNSISSAILRLPNVAKLDLVVPAGASIEETMAAEATTLDRLSGGFDTVIVRGTGLAQALQTRSIRSRTLFYGVGMITPGNTEDGRCTDEAALHLMGKHAGLIFQNERTRDIFLRSMPDYAGQCLVIPPSVDADDLAAARTIAPARPGQRTIVYAGKQIREYGVLELLEAVQALRRRRDGKDIRLVLLGNKFDGNDREFQPTFERLVAELGDGVTWIPAASPREVLGWVRQAQVVWGWRIGEFETSHFEVSTKMIEAIASGSPIVLYPSEGNIALLGAEYSGFARTARQAAIALRELLGADKTRFQKAFRQVGARFLSNRAYRPLGERLDVPARGRRVVIASHDFRFIEDIEASFLQAGHRVMRQTWSGHTRVDEQGGEAMMNAADIIHCEWCLGNAVYWSNNLPRGARLFIRLHLQEIFTDHPGQVNWNKVEKCIFISAHIMRQAIERFGIPAEKCIVIPISVAMRHRDYSDAELLAKRDTLGMVGITPWRKRPDLALDLFDRLRRRYPQLRLLVKGNTPSAYSWMKSRQEELAAYQGLFHRYETLARQGTLLLSGYDDNMEEFYQRAGWVLSTSDFEGCHTAVAEGGLFGSLPLMLNWGGADEVYPPRYVQPDLDALEAAFHAWYANYLDESRAIRARFLQEFRIESVAAAWARLFGLAREEAAQKAPRRARARAAR